jgi:NADH-quinone oxidoreductase subunit E
MKRETATILLNRLVDEQIWGAKKAAEKDIEKTVEEKLAETKLSVLDIVEQILRERIPTGRAAILAVLERAADEPNFAAQLEDNPEKTLEAYSLSPVERMAIIRRDIAQIEKWAGKLDHRQSKWLRSRLQETSDISRSETFLKGLELLEAYYSLGLDHLPATLELSNFVSEAAHIEEHLKSFRQKEETIRKTVQELSAIDEIINRYGGNRNALIQILLDIQEQNRWLPKTALRWVSERLGVQMAQIYQIATFYKAFSLTPPARHTCKVCQGTACQVRGAQQLLDKATDILKIEPGETDKDQRFALSTVNCLGCCALGPVVEIDGNYYGAPSRDDLKNIIAKLD